MSVQACVQKIYPSIAELMLIQTSITCTEDGCNKVFKNQSNFSMHLQKHHKKQDLVTTDCIRQFYCPITSCDYNEKIHFTKIKYLKQHYLKVHAAKNFICSKCNKSFATESVLTSHKTVCGITFTCSDCTYSYSSYEALMTHSRRKNHAILNKSAFKVAESDQKPNNNSTTVITKIQNSMQTINIIPVLFQIKNESIRVDKEVQTDSNITKNKSKSPIKRKSTQQQQTQTKKLRKSAETQTIGDCILKRAIQEAKISVKENTNNPRKCMETQTKSWRKEKDEEENNFPEKQPEMNLHFLDNENMMHTSSQTSFNNLNIFEDSSFGNCSSQTQTDIFKDEFLQSNVFMSHIETQTNDEQSLDLCSNMYTQTCNDTLLSELEFTNIQTQTNWPDYDMFVSTETQTLLTLYNTKSVLDMALNGREISHMETQTDMEFKQLLEEINA